MSRPSFESIFLELARSLAQRSACSRLQVGTVITSSDFRRVLAIGYNGNASGLPNACDSNEPGACGCLHSEENAIISCSEPRSTPKVVFVTHSPCVMCAKRIAQLGGVTQLVYSKAYRIDVGLNLLRSGFGIKTIKL